MSKRIGIEFSKRYCRRHSAFCDKDLVTEKEQPRRGSASQPSALDKMKNICSHSFDELAALAC
jgi:hypothetical protein